MVDTSALIHGLTGPKSSASRLRGFIASGERLVLPTLVLYEWFRGPRNTEELAAQEALFPTDQALTFGIEEAEVASRLYREIQRPRGRELDIAIAAHAIVRDVPLWTLNDADYVDIPGLRLLPTET